MRKLVFAALAAIALLCALPAVAQQQTTPYAGRGPSTLTFSVVAINDAATIYLSGSSWATVYWTIATAGSGAITTEVSLGGGVNWIPSAYSKRLDVVSANPSTAPWANNGPVAGTYETPLPGNCTAFRLRYQTAGTATSGTLMPGIAYSPGVPVTATISDLTEGAIGAGISTSTTPIDISGWNGVIVTGVSPTGQVVTVRQLDDAGTIIPSMAMSITAAASGTLVLNRTAGHLSANSVAANSVVGAAIIGKRIAAYLPAGGTISTGRIRIEAWR